VIPAARPYVGALWAALAASRAASTRGHREAPPGRHPARRFASAAKWLRSLLKPAENGEQTLPLEQVIVTSLRPITLEGPVAHTDASLWGAGGALFLKGVPVEFWETAWTEEDAKELGYELYDPAGQTAWEYLCILLTLILWAPRFKAEGLALLGDNLAALTGAISLRGKNRLTRITRELTCRKVKGAWHFAAGHLPTEENKIADALSRMHAPPPDRASLPQDLSGAVRVEAIDRKHLWST